MNEDEKLYGGPGIDTEKERDILNYRPELKYEREKISTPDQDQSPIVPPQVQNITKASLKQLWSDIVDIVEELEEKEQEYSKKLEDTNAKIPEEMIEEVKEAASYYQYDVTKTIPFSLYKVALSAKPSRQRQIILDIFEDYHADVDGSLLAEVYPDIVEMIEDWTDAITFVKSGVFAQLVPSGSVPTNLDKNSDAIQSIDQQEKKLGKQYEELLGIKKMLENEVRRLYAMASASTEYVEKKKELSQLNSQIKYLQRRLYSKHESSTLSNLKVREAQSLMRILNRATEYDPYRGERKYLLENLLKPYIAGHSLENGLRKIQTLLKLSIDGKNDQISDLKTNLRNLSGRDNRIRINKTLVSSIHLRNEVFGDVIDTVSKMEGMENSIGLGMVAQHIVDSIGFSDELYQQHMGDFHKMHGMEAELRKDKIVSLLDKDSAREIYQLLNEAIEYGNSMQRWPNEKTLSIWIEDFLSSRNLF